MVNRMRNNGFFKASGPGLALVILATVTLLSGCASKPEVLPKHSRDRGDVVPNWIHEGSVISGDQASIVIGQGQGATRAAALKEAESDIFRQLLLYIGVEVTSASVSDSETPSGRSDYLDMKTQGYIEGARTSVYQTTEGDDEVVYMKVDLTAAALKSMRADRRARYDDTLTHRLDLLNATRAHEKHALANNGDLTRAAATGEFTVAIKGSLADAKEKARAGARLDALQQLSAKLFGQQFSTRQIGTHREMKTATQGRFRSIEVGHWVWREQQTVSARFDMVGFKGDEDSEND